MRVSAVTATLGAEIEEVDLASLDADDSAKLTAALDRHLVLRARKQNLDRYQMRALGRFFGPPFLHPLVSNGFDDCPEVLELLREPDDAAMFGGESWHADVSWMSPGGYVSILHGIEIPPVGGDTAFASTIAAFEALSEGMKNLLRNLRAVHCYHWSERRDDPEFSAIHPVVRRHEPTGREGLYINRMFASHFEHMTVAESAPLLEQLFAHLEKHEFTCRFRWQPGDVLIWDNRFTLHFPINDFSGHRRLMIRTSCLEQAK